MYTLNEKGVQLRNFLTTDPERELGGVRGGGREKAIRIVLYIRNEGIFDPDIAHEITLGTNGYSDFVVRTKGTDVVHTLGLHGEVGMALVVLTEKADLGVASDVHILSTDRH